MITSLLQQKKAIINVEIEQTIEETIISFTRDNNDVEVVRISNITGEDGAPGVDGNLGPTGDRGPNGASGSLGPTGAFGPQGGQGNTGLLGPKGYCIDDNGIYD